VLVAVPLRWYLDRHGFYVVGDVDNSTEWLMDLANLKTLWRVTIVSMLSPATCGLFVETTSPPLPSAA
jgi:hypothetical protein